MVENLFQNYNIIFEKRRLRVLGAVVRIRWLVVVR
jgi:hypothetical protein